MNIETERRFLVNSNCQGFTPGIFNKIFNENYEIIWLEEITQYYFKNNTKEFSQRIRDEYFESFHKHQYTLNIKSNINFISRYEFEKTISEDDFKFLLTTCCNKVLNKYRYEIKVNKNKWEFNYLPYHHLLIAEIELKNENKKLDVPFKYEKEVTYDSNFLAESLAVEKIIKVEEA